jgi:hypothetical protein
MKEQSKLDANRRKWSNKLSSPLVPLADHFTHRGRFFVTAKAATATRGERLNTVQKTFTLNVRYFFGFSRIDFTSSRVSISIWLLLL